MKVFCYFINGPLQSYLPTGKFWKMKACTYMSYGISDRVFNLQVDAIQGCGGQLTADAKRFRTGGGVLWNILKKREPKAYKETMAKGREFEVPNYDHRNDHQLLD